MVKAFLAAALDNPARWRLILRPARGQRTRHPSGERLEAYAVAALGMLGARG